MAKIKVTAIEHDYICTYAICEVIEGSCAWDEVYHIYNCEGKRTSNLNFSEFEIEKMDKSPEGNERCRVEIYIMDKSEYEEALKEYPDRIIAPGFMLVGEDDEITAMPEGNTDAKSDSSESDDILSVEKIRSILDTALSTTKNERTIGTINLLSDKFEKDLSAAKNEEEIASVCRYMTTIIPEISKLISKEVASEFKSIFVNYDSLENNDAIKAANTDVFGVYNMLKNDEISSDSKFDFTTATRNELRIYSRKKNGDMNKLIDGIEKNFLMINSFNRETRQGLLGLYGAQFSNGLAHFLGEKETVKNIKGDISSSFAADMAGSLKETRNFYARKAASLPPKPEKKIIRINTIIALITGILSLLVLLPSTGQFFTGKTATDAIEIVFFIILVMGFIKARFKGVLISFAGLIAAGLVMDAFKLNITTRMIYILFFVLTFFVSTKTVISQKRRSKTKQYKATAGQRASYARDVDEILNMIAILKDISLEATPSDSRNAQFILDAYYDGCTSAFRNIKNMLY